MLHLLACMNQVIRILFNCHPICVYGPDPSYTFSILASDIKFHQQKNAAFTYLRESNDTCTCQLPSNIFHMNRISNTFSVIIQYLLRDIFRLYRLLFNIFRVSSVHFQLSFIICWWISSTLYLPIDPLLSIHFQLSFNIYRTWILWNEFKL